MKRYLPFAAALLLVILSVPSIPQTCGVRCGKERWKVKTLTDTTVVKVGLDPVEKSINWLRTRTRPSSLPREKRLIGIETMTFKIKGVVLSYLKEDDKDFHVIIAQSNNHGRTMIVEFPDPNCANVCSSGFLDQIRKAREDFIARFGEPPTGDFGKPEHPTLVEVIGVGFFDRMHGQRGRALPSGIELHPVISFKALE